jgi:hypothetical protein
MDDQTRRLLEAAEKRIEDLNLRAREVPEQDRVLRDLRIALGKLDPDSAALSIAAGAFGRALKQKISRIVSEVKQIEDDCRRFRKLADNNCDEDNYFAGRAKEEVKRIAPLQKYQDLLQTKLTRLEEAPKTFFLPVGSKVRVINLPAPAPEAIGGESMSFPEIGTEAVVIGPTADGDRSVRIAIAWEMKIISDPTGIWIPDGERPMIFRLDPENLEVLEPGRFLDGNPCEAIVFEPTHHHADDEEKLEMVVESRGIFWRFTESDRDPFTLLRACEDMDELDYLEPIGGEGRAVPSP